MRVLTASTWPARESSWSTVSSSVCRSAVRTRSTAVSARPGKGNLTTSVGPVFVGDLWVLAGQSNMEGSAT